MFAPLFKNHKWQSRTLVYRRTGTVHWRIYIIIIRSMKIIIIGYGGGTQLPLESVPNSSVRKFLIRSPPKSCSLDLLPTFILREFLDELLPFICIMCNVSLQHGLLPDSQKAAIVTPILKKHDLDRDDVKSYRPISNLAFISKVIERIVASQLTGYLHMNKLLPDHQSAYRLGTTALQHYRLGTPAL